MRSMRVLATLAIAGLLSAGAVVDLRERPSTERIARNMSALASATGVTNTWFCPGGSGLGGVAEATIRMVNGSDHPSTAAVSVLPDGAGPLQDRTVDVEIEPRGGVLFQPSPVVPGAEWVGAVVETDRAEIVVEQIVSAGQGGVGRSLCLTRTSDSWVVPDGATRLAVEGETFVLMLLNPFPDVAVADIELVADTGRDSIDGLVVPARRVVAVDVTEEVTVASTVAAFVDVVSGRVAASWIQVSDGLVAGRGARTAAAVPGAAPLWYLPVAATGPSRRDVVAVTNPSVDDVAGVDLEIVVDDPHVEVGPIEITVRPGRTSLVDLAALRRLDGLGSLSVAVRSLAGVPVVASINSVVFAEASDGTPAEAVPGSTATIGADAAANRWLVPAEAAASEREVRFHDGASALVIVNPSSAGIAEIDISVDGELVRSLEIGPRRRRRLPLAWLGSDRFMVEVQSSAPVIVGHEFVGLTSRTASLGAAVSDPVPLAAIR